MLISDATLKSLRAIHTSAMMDEAELLKYTPGGVDEYNMPEPDQFTYLATLPCSFRPGSSKEAAPEGDTPLLDGLISFDFDVEIAQAVDLSNFDRVKITKLHGERLAKPLLFDLAGPAQRDTLTNLFPLERVTKEEAGGG